MASRLTGLARVARLTPNVPGGFARLGSFSRLPIRVPGEAAIKAGDSRNPALIVTSTERTFSTISGPSSVGIGLSRPRLSPFSVTEQLPYTRNMSSAPDSGQSAQPKISASGYPLDSKGRELLDITLFKDQHTRGFSDEAVVKIPPTTTTVGPGGVIHAALIEGCRVYEQIVRDLGADPWTGFTACRVLAGRVHVKFAESGKYPSDPKIVGGVEALDKSSGRFRVGAEVRRGDKPVVHAAADMFLYNTEGGSPTDYEVNERLIDGLGDHEFSPKLSFESVPDGLAHSTDFPLIIMQRNPGLDETDRNNNMKFNVAMEWANCSIYNAMKANGILGGHQKGLRVKSLESNLYREVFREQRVVTVTYPPVAKGSAIVFRSDLFVEGKPKESPVATVLTTMQYDDENGDPSARAEELVRALEDKARHGIVLMSTEYRNL